MGNVSKSSSLRGVRLEKQLAPFRRDITPPIDSVKRPSRNASTNSGKLLSASPEHTKSIKWKDRWVCNPIASSQFAPPNTMDIFGNSALIRLAKARHATCCENVDVNPTTSYDCHSTESKHSAKNGSAMDRHSSSECRETFGLSDIEQCWINSAR